MNSDIHAESRSISGSLHRHALPLSLLVVLVTLFVIEIVSRYSDWNAAGTIESQADLSGSFNGGAIFQAVVLIIAALLTLRLARDDWERPRKYGWLLLALSFVLLGVESAVGRPGPDMWTYLPGIALTVPALYFLRQQVRGHRAGQGLIVLTVLLVLSNVATELAKRSIVQTNSNYVFRPDTGLYEFTGTAWDRLWLVSNVQEFTEVAAIICLIAVIGIASDVQRH